MSQGPPDTPAGRREVLQCLQIRVPGGSFARYGGDPVAWIVAATSDIPMWVLREYAVAMARPSGFLASLARRLASPERHVDCLRGFYRDIRAGPGQLKLSDQYWDDRMADAKQRTIAELVRQGATQQAAEEFTELQSRMSEYLGRGQEAPGWMYEKLQNIKGLPGK